MKYELKDDDIRQEMEKMKIKIQKHHLDIIDGVPDHCIEVAIADYLYSTKYGCNLEEIKISEDNKELCD